MTERYDDASEFVNASHTEREGVRSGVRHVRNTRFRRGGHAVMAATPRSGARGKLRDRPPMSAAASGAFNRSDSNAPEARPT